MLGSLTFVGHLQLFIFHLFFYHSHTFSSLFFIYISWCSLSYISVKANLLSIFLSFPFVRKPSTFSFFDLFSPMYLVSIYIFFSAIFSFLCHPSNQLDYIHAFISTLYFCFYFILHLNFSYLLSVIFVVSVLSCLYVVHLVCNFKLCFCSISFLSPVLYFLFFYLQVCIINQSTISFSFLLFYSG